LETVLNIASVPFMVAIVHELLRVYKIIINNKVADNNRENFIKLIPLVAAVLGMCVGIGAYFLQLYGTSITNAILVGIVSGLGATGADQVVKQLRKSKTIE